jgi:hypothetical protein
MPTCWSAQGDSTHESFAAAGHASAELAALCCSQIYTCKAYNKVRRLMPCSMLQPTGL